MKHIYIFNETCNASNYGVKTYIEQLLSCLSNESFEVTLINLFSEGSESSTICNDYIKQLNIPNCIKSINTIEEYDIYFRNCAYVISCSIDYTEDVFFHFNFITSESMLDVLRYFFPKCVIIYTIHSFIGLIDDNIINKDISVPQQDDYIHKKINFYLECGFFKKIDRLVCLSSYSYNFLLNIYGINQKKIILVNNGIRDDYVKLSKNERILIKKKYRIDSNSKILLFVGRLKYDKGLFHTIQSFKEVITKYPNSVLIIVGDGCFQDYLRLTIGYWPNIYFTGKLDRKDLFELYKIADIGVFPSFSEQCSFVAIEMLMFGIPMIVTKIGGFKGMVEDGRNGFMIPIDSSDTDGISTKDLAEKIIFILSNATNTFSKHSRHIFLRNYNISKVSKLILTIYNP